MDKLLTELRLAYPNLSVKRIFTLLVLLVPALTFASGHPDIGGLVDLLLIAEIVLMALICLVTFVITRLCRKSQSKALEVIALLLNLLLLYISFPVIRSAPFRSFRDGITFNNSILVATSIPKLVVA